MKPPSSGVTEPFLPSVPMPGHKSKTMYLENNAPTPMSLGRRVLAMGWVSLHKETQVTLLNETEALDTKDRRWGQEGGVWPPEHLLVLW